METKARKFFNLWKRKELEMQKQVLEESVRKHYEVEFQKWKQKRKIREDLKKVKWS